MNAADRDHLLGVLAVAALLAAPPTRAAAGSPPASVAASEIPGAPRVHEDPTALELFRAAGVDGAFVLLDVARNEVTVVNPAIAERRYVPCSTFKIPNTLIGLETGVIPGPELTLRWDGQVREVAAWNRDHTLATAMRDSVVWFFQELARRVGLARMRSEVARLGYGNAEIGDRVDRFWLDGPLRISPREQVAFLRRLQAGLLPVRPGHAALVRQLVVLEQAPGFTFRGKTGLGRQEGTAVGWLVGEVDHDGAVFVYALLALDASGELDRVASARRPLAERLLARYGALAPR